MLVRFYNIEWDTDGEYADLPKEFELALDDDFDVEENSTELLSQHFGFLIESCQWEVVIPSEEEVYDQ